MSKTYSKMLAAICALFCLVEQGYSSSSDFYKLIVREYPELGELNEYQFNRAVNAHFLDYAYKVGLALKYRRNQLVAEYEDEYGEHSGKRVCSPGEVERLSNDANDYLKAKMRGLYVDTLCNPPCSIPNIDVKDYVESYSCAKEANAHYDSFHCIDDLSDKLKERRLNETLSRNNGNEIRYRLEKSDAILMKDSRTRMRRSVSESLNYDQKFLLSESSRPTNRSIRMSSNSNSLNELRANPDYVRNSVNPLAGIGVNNGSSTTTRPEADDHTYRLNEGDSLLTNTRSCKQKRRQDLARHPLPPDTPLAILGLGNEGLNSVPMEHVSTPYEPETYRKWEAKCFDSFSSVKHLKIRPGKAASQCTPVDQGYPTRTEYVSGRLLADYFEVKRAISLLKVGEIGMLASAFTCGVDRFYLKALLDQGSSACAEGGTTRSLRDDEEDLEKVLSGLTKDEDKKTVIDDQMTIVATRIKKERFSVGAPIQVWTDSKGQIFLEDSKPNAGQKNSQPSTKKLKEDREAAMATAAPFALPLLGLSFDAIEFPAWLKNGAKAGVGVLSVLTIPLSLSGDSPDHWKTEIPTIENFYDPTSPPADGYEWKGRPGSQPGSKQGNWVNPTTGESLRPDIDHPEPIGPHWDWKDEDGDWWRIDPDGRAHPKNPRK